METISVDVAIKKGRWLLFWSPLLVFFGTMGLGYVFIIYFTAGDVIWINILLAFAQILLPFAIMIIYYSLMLSRWRIWAFTNVRNVHELKRRAILAQIYPKDGSFFWRLEIKTAEQKRIIETLNNKFQRPDIFEEDYSIPFETTYSYSKADRFLYLLFSIGTASCAVFLFSGSEVVFGLLLAGGSIIFGVTAYKRFNANEPLLTLSNDGITTIEEGFHPWNSIQNEQIILVNAGQSSSYKLSYDVDGKAVEMSLMGLPRLVSPNIDHVLRTYRDRYEASKSS